MHCNPSKQTKSFLCLLLCVLLVFGGGACNGLASSKVPDEVIPEHAELNYADMTYTRPDLDAVNANFELALSLAGQDNAQEQLFETYDTLLEQISQISTMDTLATLQNEID